MTDLCHTTLSPSLPHPIDIPALEAEFNGLNTREIETSETCIDDPTTSAEIRACADWCDAVDARDAFITKLVELSSTDLEVTRFKARVYTAMWHENHRDGLTHWVKAALEPHEETIDLSDAMARSIARDVFDQAMGPLLVAHRHGYFSHEDETAELEAVRRRAEARSAAAA